MQEIKLDVQIREKIGAQGTKQVRNHGDIPAIVYGGDKPPTAVKTSRQSYEAIMRKHRGETVVFHLNVREGEKALRDYSALVQEVQYHPVSDQIVHIDFKRISLKERVEVQVPLQFKGEPIGLKSGGTLEQSMYEIDVVSMPLNIPKHIDVDVSGLNIDDVLYVKDLVLPAGVETNHELDDIICSVVEIREEELEEDGEEAEAAELEVIKEKKVDDEGSKKD